jgi:hypothetical protein
MGAQDATQRLKKITQAVVMDSGLTPEPALGRAKRDPGDVPRNDGEKT